MGPTPGARAMTVLVTGGAGYIGCTVVPLLLEQGYHVRVLDNLMYDGRGLIAQFRHPHFEFINGDVRDAAAVRGAIQGCEAVIHLAAIVGFPACRKYPELAEQVNLGGTRTVAAAAGRQIPVIYASSGSNYGALVDRVCTEETPLKPASLYGRTKAAAEQLLLEQCRTVAYRFATAFGASPRLRLDLLVNDFVYHAVVVRHLVVYEKDYIRSFIHVFDMARALVFALQHLEAMAGQVYNVGSQTMTYSKAAVCEMIRQQTAFYLHYAEVDQDEDQRNYEVSYAKIASLGYQTTVALDEGIRELIRVMALIKVPNPYLNV